MASPHVAGAAAVLLQANPNLTPDQVRLVLQSTASPVTRFGSSTIAPFWQVGYGYVDLSAAITLVRSKSWAKDLARAQAKADARVLAEDGFKASKSDFWTYDAPRVTAFGITDTRSYTSTVPLGVTFLKVALSHPSFAAIAPNGMQYTVTVKDAAGNVVGVTTEAPLLAAGTSSVLIDLRAVSPAVVYGTFTFDVSGDLAASDPDTLDSDSALGRMVTLEVVQLTQG
jgi:serine protease AprX